MADKQNVFYTEEHGWLEVNGKTVRLGVSDFAVEQLGEVVYVELPDVDDELDAEEEYGSVESVKSVSEVYVPVAGKVTAINEVLEDSPEKVNEDPFGEGWFIEIEAEEDVDTSAFMDRAAYEDFVD